VTMLIPVGGSDFDLVPFVRISGELTLEEGTFDDLFAEAAGDELFIVLDKYRPTGDYAVAGLDGAYDYELYQADELGDGNSVSFNFLAPANTTVYLWASTDLDADGLANDPGEAWACNGEEPCSLETAEANISGLALNLVASPGEE
jgi:hypothetical protein